MAELTDGIIDLSGKPAQPEITDASLVLEVLSNNVTYIKDQESEGTKRAYCAAISYGL